MRIYTIGNESGKRIKIKLDGHLQHIWHTSEIDVSAKIAARIKRELGAGPYTNPCGDFGRAQTVVF